MALKPVVIAISEEVDKLATERIVADTLICSRNTFRAFNEEVFKILGITTSQYNYSPPRSFLGMRIIEREDIPENQIVMVANDDTVAVLSNVGLYYVSPNAEFMED